jgi:alpha-mannosidase
VWNGIKRVDIEDRLNKTQTYNQEAAYFAFPFAASQPVFRYEIPCGVVRVDKDMIPGACQAWFTQQHFVQLESNDGSVTWSSPDAPLVCLEDINRGVWPAPLPIVNGHLFSYIMNNYWWTNYKAGQGGDFVFRYAFTSDAKADVAESTRFGAGVASPLLATVSAPNSAGTLTEPAAGWLRVQEPNVVLFGMPKADAGTGIVLHLRETAGQSIVAHVTFVLRGIHQATLCNLMESPQGALAIQDGVIAIPMRPWSITAIKLE